MEGVTPERFLGARLGFVGTFWGSLVIRALTQQIRFKSITVQDKNNNFSYCKHMIRVMFLYVMLNFMHSLQIQNDRSNNEINILLGNNKEQSVLRCFHNTAKQLACFFSHSMLQTSSKAAITRNRVTKWFYTLTKTISPNICFRDTGHNIKKLQETKLAISDNIIDKEQRHFYDSSYYRQSLMK